LEPKYFASLYRCIVLANGPATGRMYGDWHMKDSHIDAITTHPAMKTILYQVLVLLCVSNQDGESHWTSKRLPEKS